MLPSEIIKILTVVALVSAKSVWHPFLGDGVGRRLPSAFWHGWFAGRASVKWSVSKIPKICLWVTWLTRN